jgi:hypothetical protein
VATPVGVAAVLTAVVAVVTTAAVVSSAAGEGMNAAGRNREVDSAAIRDRKAAGATAVVELPKVGAGWALREVHQIIVRLRVRQIFGQRSMMASGIHLVTRVLPDAGKIRCPHTTLEPLMATGTVLMALDSTEPEAASLERRASGTALAGAVVVGEAGGSGEAVAVGVVGPSDLEVRSGVPSGGDRVGPSAGDRGGTGVGTARDGMELHIHTPITVTRTIAMAGPTIRHHTLRHHHLEVRRLPIRRQARTSPEIMSTRRVRIRRRTKIFRS